MPMAPSISVIVPNLNSPTINRTLAALRTQALDLSAVEVLVVGCDEPGLIRPDTLVRVVDAGGPRSAAANRNLGMSLAQGEIVCFTDADCIPAADWLGRLTEPYADATVQVVGGGIRFPARPYWNMADNISWFSQFLASAPSGERPHLPSLNLSVRRSVIQAVGGFSESYRTAAGEDTEWTLRMRANGYRLQFRADAVVTHAPNRAGIGDLWRHAYQYGRYSPKVSPSVRAAVSMPEQRWLPMRWWAVLLLTPVLATLATGRVVARHARDPRTWEAAPGVWLSKLAWCLGASAGLREAGL